MFDREERIHFIDKGLNTNFLHIQTSKMYKGVVSRMTRYVIHSPT